MTPVQSQRIARNIRVESQVVKRVGGKHRYFFEIRNLDPAPFGGSVKIILVGDAGPLAKDTFTATRAIEPALGASVYVDANTGPISVHGSAGIKTFKYEVAEAGAVVYFGTGIIMDKVETF